MPPRLAHLIGTIQGDQAIRIFEYLSRKFETHVVLALVEEILSLIPLVAHLYIQIVSWNIIVSKQPHERCRKYPAASAYSR